MPAPRWARPLGLALLIYGVFGLVLLAAGLLAISAPLDAVDRLTVSFEVQRTALLSSMRDTSRTLVTAADAAAGFDDSLAQSRASAERAADLSREVSGTMTELADSMRISIFGTQPLASLAPPFERAGTQLDQLGTDMDAIAAALDANAGQVRTTALELTRLQGSVDRLVTGVDSATDIGLTSGSLAPLRFGVVALMVWLAGLALGCVICGWSILRWWRRSLPTD